ncbi:MAG: F0F1 ATP synthase subunit B [Treponema sp.]|nr:F0F1 ATP synthase subunit B [Treponema sp.]
MQEQALVSIAPWTFLATIANLFIQVYLIKRFLFRPVSQIVEKRKAIADAEIGEAQEVKNEAREMKKEYEQNMQDAKKKAQDILLSAQKTAVLQSEEILKEASERAKALKKKAESDIAQEKRKVVYEIKEEIGGIAVELAEKVLEREISESDHARLIDAFIENAGQVS